MAVLQPMPNIVIPSDQLQLFGRAWRENNQRLKRTPPYSSLQLGYLIDKCVAEALATLLGNIPVKKPRRGSLIPSEADCVEISQFKIVGGVRAQDFDVGYRPDGVRIAFDSKTLNDLKSVGKNYQNMINDLATEATTLHTRFPYAVVCFIVAIPTPCLQSPQKEAMTGTLERLSLRSSPLDSVHKAEAISLVLWDPSTGRIESNWPPSDSCLNIEQFSRQVEHSYVERYKGLPPHAE